MRMRFLAVTLTLVAVVAILGVRSSAHAPQTPAQPPSLTKEDAAGAMRMILTIQANRPFGKGRYGLLEEVLAGVSLAGEDPVIVDRQTATYRGYTIRILRTPEMTKFDLTMVPSGGLCGQSYFANEQNVIFSGTAIGCPAQQASGR